MTLDQINNFLQNTVSSTNLGKSGEEAAAMFLVKHGFSIINRNYRHKFGEVDIIAEKSGKLHFIEVKSVSRETYNGNYQSTETQYKPEDNVNNLKISKIEKVSNFFINKYGLHDKQIQIDVIGVIFVKGSTDVFIDYIQNANLYS
jgi:putative endonuclease